MLTGHSFRTLNQSLLSFSESAEDDRVLFRVKLSLEIVAWLRRRREAGTVKRRLESRVTIMVGLSHLPTGRSIAPGRCPYSRTA